MKQLLMVAIFIFPLAAMSYDNDGIYKRVGPGVDKDGNIAGGSAYYECYVDLNGHYCDVTLRSKSGEVTHPECLMHGASAEVSQKLGTLTQSNEVSAPVSSPSSAHEYFLYEYNRTDAHVFSYRLYYNGEVLIQRNAAPDNFTTLREWVELGCPAVPAEINVIVK